VVDAILLEVTMYLTDFLEVVFLLDIDSKKKKDRCTR
jgi:hypothetical protein